MVLQGLCASCASACSMFTVCWLFANFSFMFYLNTIGDRPPGAVTRDILGALLLIYVFSNYKKLFCLLALHRQEQDFITCWSKILIGAIDFVCSFIWPPWNNFYQLTRLWFSFPYFYYEKFNFKILKKKVYNSNNDQSAKKKWNRCWV